MKGDRIIMAIVYTQPDLSQLDNTNPREDGARMGSNYA